MVQWNGQVRLVTDIWTLKEEERWRLSQPLFPPSNPSYVLQANSIDCTLTDIMASSIITRSLLFSSLWSSLSSALILPTSSPQTDILSARSKPPKFQSSWNIMGALFPCVFIIIAVYFLVEHCYVRANRGFDQVESPQWTSSQLGEDGYVRERHNSHCNFSTTDSTLLSPALNTKSCGYQICWVLW